MSFVIPALIAFLATVLAIFPTIKIAKKFNLLDHPQKRPHPAHIQNRVVPRAGGLAIFFGLISSILLFISPSPPIIGIIFGLLILLIVGLLDDRYPHLSPYLRLVSQFMAAFFVVSQGVDIKFITNPLGGIINFSPLFASILALLWIVWVMNMINWSKGVDGQMPGITTMAAIILGLLSIKLNFLGDPSQADIAKLSFITAASSLGLLIFNWYPAKIFPGFSGSTILGFMIAVLAILSGAKLATAGLVLLIPATDFAYTFFRRVLQGKSPVWGDQGHLHHKLLQIGLSHSQISLFYILGSAILGAVALSLNSRGKLFAALLLATLILGGILWLNFFGALSKRRAPDSG
ncbi:undecaprenyl/decaprenyl-phosphate alpha-N-acetylglucosaminyl 1-phosphate transferase [Candidatus Daviesbacteria bacterium]|nr:undecaprenyl/decaprenyl-phosphate alpha-N-acetylglucosaminyl 1-phosphate transferase [Candidatus Daviesbacteria bacterium]MBI4035352.1 undecaprenyl/decaprenyl-phosphate alpha-N-acetylglucosaminyl 1-phosphate transferase [Candidatus Daviesbacteria bacterium]